MGGAHTSGGTYVSKHTHGNTHTRPERWTEGGARGPEPKASALTVLGVAGRLTGHRGL